MFTVATPPCDISWMHLAVMLTTEARKESYIKHFPGTPAVFYLISGQLGSQSESRLV